MIFNNFFEDYKNEIYKVSLRKLSNYEWFLVGFASISTILFSLLSILNVFSVLKLDITFILISFSIMIISFIIVFRYSKNRDKKQLNTLQKYKEKIANIITLLNKPDYNLHSISGVDLLINCCKEQLENRTGLSLFSTIKNFFIFAVYPLITLIIGTVIKDTNIDKIIPYSISIIELYIIILAFWIMIKPIFTDILFFNKFKYESLCDDLEYIRTQIE